MEIKAALALARELLDHHGLEKWQLKLDRARRRAGVCRHQDRTICLSQKLVELYQPHQLREVVLHEIAHALVGPNHGHNQVWRQMAAQVGASPKRLVSPEFPSLAAPWIGTCPAGHQIERFRTPTRVLACRQCSTNFMLEHIFTWTYLGQSCQPAGKYQQELARL